METIGRLRSFFIGRSINPYMFDYGYLSIFTRFRNNSLAKDLAAYIKTLDGIVIVIGYSNGCPITHIAAQKYGAKIDKAVYINPSLDSDVDIPANIKWMDVWHSPSDMAVKFGALRPFHLWGAMGAYGYRGDSNNYTNYNKAIDFDLMSLSHTSTWERDIIEYFGGQIADKTLVLKSFK